MTSCQNCTFLTISPCTDCGSFVTLRPIGRREEGYVIATIIFIQTYMYVHLIFPFPFQRIKHEEHNIFHKNLCLYTIMTCLQNCPYHNMCRLAPPRTIQIEGKTRTILTATGNLTRPFCLPLEDKGQGLSAVAEITLVPNVSDSTDYTIMEQSTSKTVYIGWL